MIYKRFEELKQSGALPTPSGVGLVILRRTQSETCTLDELTQCIQIDPALSGRVIKLANATALAGSVPVTTVRQAAQQLGIRAVRGVALGFTLVPSSGAGLCTRFDYDRFWSYSLAHAVGAQFLAGERGLIDPGEAFTCALLSRLGMLALATVYPEPYAGVIDASRGKDLAAFLDAETRAFEIQHWEVAASIMEDWGLPDLFTSAVLSLGSGEGDVGGEDPLQAELSRILLESSLIAEQLVSSITAREWLLGSDWTQLMAPLPACDSDLEQLRPILERARATWEEWGGLFRIPTTIGRPADPTHVDPNTLPQIAPESTGERKKTSDSASESAELNPLTPGEIKILTIDDDPRILRLLSHHLRQAGYQVLTAGNGADGLKIVLEESPHIVVTDWMMPEMTGIDVCRSLRRVDAGRKTYVLILTAREDEQQVVDAFAAGVDDYVTKPFNARILIARVQAGQRMIELQRQVEADKTMRMHQVAEMGLLTRKLRAAAQTDVLTELPNRRYAMSRLEQEWSESVRMNRPLSVVMVDIDYFKRINDTYGHDVGDVVLKQTAAVLRAKTRRGDIVCRLGGEEFLVINVNSNLQGALLCAERLRSSVAENSIQCDGFEGKVTVSLGCAERVLQTTDIDDLLKSADEAVYAAKAAGRNTIRSSADRYPESA
ncbi:MAG: diguanylate cyclase [Planctomycetes bacterium]|nr:diguanylate cyclase [Planctomycetota bacterium]